MKKLSYLSAIILMAFSMLFVSCSKDDDEDNNNDLGDPVSKVGMTAKVNGINWVSENHGCVISDGIPVIAGDCVDKYDIAITVGSFAEGTYNLTASYENFAIITDGQTTFTTLGEMQSTGSIEITSIDADKELISGTFEFVAIDLVTGSTIEVTDGQFTDVTYVEDVTPVTENELQVDINGEAFVADYVYGDTFMGFIMISSENEDATEMVNLSFDAEITEGTYSIDAVGVTGQYLIGDDILMLSDEGTLEITNHDKENNLIEGTFEFEASDYASGESASLTNGSFSVEY